MRDNSFPADPVKAIVDGSMNVEKAFIELCESKGDHSGSCAVCTLIVDHTCYIANVGDSRAVLSEDAGRTITPLSEDHKPNNPTEFDRIYKNGGNVYQ